jgi:GABA permease
MSGDIGAGPTQNLKRALRERHLSMIALGGIIGAGLFVGSGSVITSAGALAPMAYAVGGLVLVLVMRMLAEMATARPSVGSFSDYARLALGDGAGFVVGWTYWYFWVVVVAFEAVAGAEIIGTYLPEFPLWVIAAAIMTAMTGINLLSVRSFGEAEFWFASIKVAAIVAFLGLGIAGLLDALPSQEIHGIAITGSDVAPTGFSGVFSAFAVVVFSYFGAEIVTVAAAEAKDPVRAVGRATASVVWRVIIFYVGSITLIVLLVPHERIDSTSSPFVTLLDNLGVPGASQIMQFVVLTAVLSVLNSGIYASSRMLFALAARNDAPRSLATTTKRGTPARAIMLATLAGWISVAIAYVAPESVFNFLLSAGSGVALVIYAAIAVSQIRLRRNIELAGEDRPPVTIWAYPYLSWLTVGLLALVVIGMLALPGSRSELVVGLIAPVCFVVIHVLRHLRRSFRAGNEPVVPTQPATAAEATAHE